MANGNFDATSFDGSVGGFDVDAVVSPSSTGFAGGGTSEWELRKKHEWHDFTHENQRRYDEIYKKLLEKERALEAVKENARLSTIKQTEYSKLKRLTKQVGELRARLNEVSTKLAPKPVAAYNADEDLIMALYS